MKVGDLVMWKKRHPSWSHYGCVGVVMRSGAQGRAMWIAIHWATGILEECPQSMLKVINENR